MFFNLKILKLNDIFILQLSKFIHKCINSNIIENFNQWFVLNKDVHSHLTRSNFNTNSQETTNNLYIPFGRTTNYGLKQIKVCGPKIWNSLSSVTRSINSFAKFKLLVKNYLLGNYT